MIAILLLFAACPLDSAAIDRVDLIEINHLYDSDGRHVITQAIFYDWSQRDARFNVRAWRLVKSSSQLPTRDWARDCYVSRWRDIDTLRIVYAGRTRESWTRFDPEVLERDVLPVDCRRELSR